MTQENEPPDLQQAIHALLPPMAAVVRLRNLARAIPISDNDTDAWDQLAMAAGAHALEQLQAAQADVQDKNGQLLDRAMYAETELSNAETEIERLRDRVIELEHQAAQAEIERKDQP